MLSRMRSRTDTFTVGGRRKVAAVAAAGLFAGLGFGLFPIVAAASGPSHGHGGKARAGGNSGNTFKPARVHAAGAPGAVHAAATVAGNWHTEQEQISDAYGWLSASCVKGTTTCWMGGGRNVGPAAMAAKSTDGGSTWTTQTPNIAPVQNGMPAMSCPSVNVCVGGGTKYNASASKVPGVVFTKDGGMSWAEGTLPASVETTTVNRLEAVSCADTSHCIATGKNGTIVATSNGGATWTAQASGTTTELLAISCITAKRCEVAGVGGIILTTSNGTSWSPQTSNTSSTLDAISCANASSGIHCEAVGASGTIVGTANGGSTWTVQTSHTSNSLYGVSCGDATHCVAVGSTGTVVRTINGSTWVTAPSGTTASIDAVSCYSTTGCVAGTYSSSVASANALVTTKGGASWVQRVPFAPVHTLGHGYGGSGISCPGPTTCFVAGGTGQADGGRAGLILRTTDGQTWSRVYTGPGGSGVLHGMSCSSTSHCVAVGNTTTPSSVIVTTSNGGATWTPRVAGASEDLWGVSCPSATRCYATGGSGTLLASTDGGVTWASSNSGIGSSTLYGISCPTATTCFVGSEDSHVYKTTNGGTSWAATTGSVGLRPSGVSCPDVNHCVVTDGGNKTSTTTDGGTTWTTSTVILPGNTGFSLWGISCTSDLDCTASGGTGSVAAHQSLVVTTTNGGSTWTHVITPANTRGTTSVGCNKAGCWAVGANGVIISNVVPTSATGYWLTASDGGVFTFGALKFYGSTGNVTLRQPVVGMASTPLGLGYWLVASDGGIFTFGNAGYHGSMGDVKLAKPVVGMAATPNGGGYWEVASDGGVFSFGNARFFGSMGGRHLNAPVVGMASTPDGGGYWLVASDGGIFSFGDARFFGSTGNIRLHKPVVGMAADPAGGGAGGGYWLVAADGGIFSFGDAPFFGSTGNIALRQPIVGMAANFDGRGYWFVASDGGVFSFGDARFFGSLGNVHLRQPIVGMAAG